MPDIKRKSRNPIEKVKEIADAFVAWGPPLFGFRRDEAHGAKVAGVRMVRTPDGALIGVIEPTTNPTRKET